jgi:hypothetical protein
MHAAKIVSPLAPLLTLMLSLHNTLNSKEKYFYLVAYMPSKYQWKVSKSIS